MESSFDGLMALFTFLWRLANMLCRLRHKPKLGVVSDLRLWAHWVLVFVFIAGGWVGGGGRVGGWRP